MSSKIFLKQLQHCLRPFQELIKKINHNNYLCYLGDFLTVRPPESCAMEDRFIVEWE